MDERPARQSTPQEIEQFAREVQARQPEIARSGVRAASFIGMWRLEANSANAEGTDVWLTFFPNGTARLKSPLGDHELIWQFFDYIGALLIMPIELRYCQPGPKVNLTQMGNGTCRIQITHEALLPGCVHEFSRHRDAPLATLAGGKVLRLARKRWLLGTGGSLILAAILLFWRMPRALDPIKDVVSPLAAVVGFVTCLRWLLPRDRRLVIGSDRLQLVDG